MVKKILEILKTKKLAWFKNSYIDNTNTRLDWVKERIDKLEDNVKVCMKIIAKQVVDFFITKEKLGDQAAPIYI